MFKKDWKKFKEDFGNWLSCRMAHAMLRIRYYSGVSRVVYCTLLYSATINSPTTENSFCVKLFTMTSFIFSQSSQNFC